MKMFASQANGLKLVIMRDKRGGEGRRMAILLEDYLYHDPETRDVYLVPRGYVTDFASIPFPASAVLPSFGLWTEAAVVHDYLYAVGQSGKRKLADRIFRTAMEEQGVGPIVRELIYRPVRLFAGAAYGREGEWTRRFGDPEQGISADPPFPRPATAVVATGIDALAFEDAGVRAEILASASQGGAKLA